MDPVSETQNKKIIEDTASVSASCVSSHVSFYENKIGSSVYYTISHIL